MDNPEPLPANVEITDGIPATPGGSIVLSSGALWGWAAVVGFVGGLLGLAYNGVMRGSLHAVWELAAHVRPDALGWAPAFRPGVLLITTAGGLLVGLALRYIGKPGEIAAVVDNIHMERGRLDPRQTPSMVVVSLASITAGGSAGPEAPLVQILGSFGSFVGDRLKLRGDLVRTLTFCGMASALGAFFGAPLGGALFALEIPHRRGLEYYEALMPASLAAAVAFLVFRSAVGYAGPILHVGSVPDVTVTTIVVGLLVGLMGGGVGTLFIALFRRLGKLFHRLERHDVLLATLGGLLIGLAAQVTPITLFWGEEQVNGLVAAASPLRAAHGVGAVAGVMLLVAAMKMLTVSVTLHSGFRGGFIFPLFFIGAAIGVAASSVAGTVFPHVPMATVVLCSMAATNVAVTKTPISTTVILASLSGSNFMPAIAVACLASFVLTTRASLIATQRPRSAPSPWHPMAAA